MAQWPKVFIYVIRFLFIPNMVCKLKIKMLKIIGTIFPILPIIDNEIDGVAFLIGEPP